MKTLAYRIIFCIFLLSQNTDVNGQFTYLKIDAKLGDSTGGVKCMPPYGQSISYLIKLYGFSGSAMSDSMLYYFDWGDGRTWSQKKLLSRIEASLGYSTPIGTLLYYYKTTGTYKALFAMTSLSTGVTNTVFLPAVTFGDSCTTFVGKLYNDANKNCVADPGELGLNWAPIRAINTVTGDITIASDWTDTQEITVLKCQQEIM